MQVPQFFSLLTGVVSLGIFRLLKPVYGLLTLLFVKKLFYYIVLFLTLIEI